MNGLNWAHKPCQSQVERHRSEKVNHLREIDPRQKEDERPNILLKVQNLMR